MAKAIYRREDIERQLSESRRVPPLHRRNPAGHAQEAKAKLERNGATHHPQAPQEN